MTLDLAEAEREEEDLFVSRRSRMRHADVDAGAGVDGVAAEAMVLARRTNDIKFVNVSLPIKSTRLWTL
ncbi:hypothetical protein M378DRAFT_167722 [Amanita muscaria Koide BX008]|uniref:Uncharacterized protein n=1 Tax=Amanita muscaria (strain Koide BX008) TaxID=946122 RepID=A0A0C2WVC3_AMAMK|nr:hypothetical protein M378DRAFT_167722 [Amanita muscaria Koide BX008]